MSDKINIAGGELAAQIAPKIRIQMIQSGYNPLNPDDVERYMNHQQPVGDMKAIIMDYGEEGQGINTMGEKHMNYRKDYAAIKQTFQEGNLDLDSLDNLSGDENNQLPEDVDQPITNPKEYLKQKMENNTRGERRNVNDTLNDTVFSRSPSSRQQQLDKEPICGPIALPKQHKVYITEGKEASSLGYQQACKYINAFITQIKNPTSEGRNKFIHALNEMVLIEEKVHPQILHEYRKGVARAEAELYSNIKKTKS